MMLLLLLLRLVAALDNGDCAFVGTYGDDDWALVLLEDVGGEQIYVADDARRWR